MADDVFSGNDARRAKYALNVIIVTVILLWSWCTILIAAVCFSNKKDMDGETIRVMFSSCVTGLGMTIALLALKGAAEAILARFTGGFVTQPLPMKKEETVTKTTTITPAEPLAPMQPPVPQDLTVKDLTVEGDLNASPKTTT